MPHIMHDHLTALLDGGYEVRLERWDGDGDQAVPRYWAHITERGGSNPRTAEGKSPAAAVWAASPLHADDEQMPDIINLIAEHGEGFRDIGAIIREAAEAREAFEGRDLADDVTYLIGDNAKLADRISRLEADKRDLSMMIRMAGDLFTRAFPDGLLARRGDQAVPPETVTVDSHKWNCSACGAECIGPEPEGSLGRCCGGE